MDDKGIKRGAFRYTCDDQRGGISILLVIILPVIILGCVLAYSLLQLIENENEMQKLAYASSESYLSRYNGFIFNEFGILANTEDLSFENLTKQYAIKNKLITNLSDITIESHRDTLTDPEVFINALNNAAVVVVTQSALEKGFEIFEQNKQLAKFKTLMDRLSHTEKKLEKYFEKNEINLLKMSLLDAKSVEMLGNYKNSIKQYLEKLSREFEADMRILMNQLSEVVDMEKNEAISTVFYNQKYEEFINVEDSFSKWCKEISAELEAVDIIEEKIRVIETDITVLEFELTEIQSDIEKLASEEDVENLNEFEIDNLHLIKEQLVSSIDACNADIERLLNEVDSVVKMEIKETGKSIYESILDALYKLEQNFSGIEIGDKKLEIPDALDHTKDTFHFESELFSQKVLISEYLLTVFKSYDRNCPRKFEFNDRLTNERTINGEIEYIITGESEEQNSMSKIRLSIIALRIPSNLLSLMQSSDKLKQLGQLTVALPQPWRAIAFSSGILLWSTAESYTDVNALLKGEGVAMIKKSTDWRTDIKALLKADSSSQKYSSIKADDKVKNNVNSNLYYQDYLRVLLYVQSFEKTIKRTMTLFELEINQSSEACYTLSNFSRGHIVTIKWKDSGRLLSRTHQLGFFNSIDP